MVCYWGAICPRARLRRAKCFILRNKSVSNLCWIPESGLPFWFERVRRRRVISYLKRRRILVEEQLQSWTARRREQWTDETWRWRRRLRRCHCGSVGGILEWTAPWIPQAYLWQHRDVTVSWLPYDAFTFSSFRIHFLHSDGSMAELRKHLNWV